MPSGFAKSGVVVKPVILVDKGFKHMLNVWSFWVPRCVAFTPQNVAFLAGNSLRACQLRSTFSANREANLKIDNIASLAGIERM